MPLPFEKIREDELEYIRSYRNFRNLSEDCENQQVSLALSGGGIRSASFQLGVLQGLASAGLLKYVDYVSAVSGGAYTGAEIVRDAFVSIA